MRAPDCGALECGAWQYCTAGWGPTHEQAHRCVCILVPAGWRRGFGVLGRAVDSTAAGARPARTPTQVCRGGARLFMSMTAHALQCSHQPAASAATLWRTGAALSAVREAEPVLLARARLGRAMPALALRRSSIRTLSHPCGCAHPDRSPASCPETPNMQSSSAQPALQCPRSLWAAPLTG